jgi:hypothetical protein
MDYNRFRRYDVTIWSVPFWPRWSPCLTWFMKFEVETFAAWFSDDDVGGVRWAVVTTVYRSGEAGGTAKGSSDVCPNSNIECNNLDYQ